MFLITENYQEQFIPIQAELSAVKYELEEADENVRYIEVHVSY